jgi:two-component sensor histidine kinase
LRRPDGTSTWVLGQAAEERDPEDRLVGFVGTVTDISERKRLEEQKTLLLRELDHRVKNVMATVSSIARLTNRLETDPQAAFDAFQKRIQALAQTHTLLTQANWSGAPLTDVLRAELLPFGKRRIELKGPDVLLSSRAAIAFSLVLHELATNAAKYGALSSPEGRVAVHWTVLDQWLRLTWQEDGGPPVKPPDRKGFGSVLIPRSMEQDLGGKVIVEFKPEGVLCVLEMPLSNVAGESSGALREETVASNKAGANTK